MSWPNRVKAGRNVCTAPGFHDDTTAKNGMSMGALGHLAVNFAGLNLDILNLEDALGQDDSMLAGSI